MWDIPGSGIEPVSPALAHRFLTPNLEVNSSWQVALIYPNEVGLFFDASVKFLKISKLKISKGFKMSFFFLRFHKSLNYAFPGEKYIHLIYLER